MLTHPTLDKLREMRLTGMIEALDEQLNNADSAALDFEERLALLVDRELTHRHNRRLQSRLKQAGFHQPAAWEDIDLKSPRGLDKSLMFALADCQWIQRHLNCLIVGPRNRISITIPPLRERRGDIAPLVSAIISNKRSHNGQPYKMTSEAMDLLKRYDFPGNIRELKNILQKAISLSNSNFISPELLKFDEIANVYVISPLADRRGESRQQNNTPPATNRSITEVEATHIESLLHQYNGHRAKVSEVLHISERTLYRKLKQYNLTEVGKHRS